MNDQQAIDELKEGYEHVLNLSRMIALMPIEHWLEDLERGECVASVTDPTLYKKYIYSNKPKILKKVLSAALELKRTILEVQPDVIKEMEKEENEDTQRK